MTTASGDQSSRAFGFWLTVALLVACQIAIFVLGMRKAIGGQVDLRAFYAAGAILRSPDRAQLYDYDLQNRVQNAVAGPRHDALPFLYPAFAAVPFVPLSCLSYRCAFLVWLAISLGLIALTARLLQPHLPYFQSLAAWRLPLLYLSVFGVWVALVQGQISFLLLLVYVGAWLQIRAGRSVSAGLLLSLALMKYQIVLPVVLLLALWRQWRTVTAFVAGGALLAALSVSLTGIEGARLYVRSMSAMAQQTALHATAAKAHYGMFPTDMPNLHGITFALAHGATWGLALNAVLSCAVLIFAARQRASLTVALPVAMLVSYHMQPHDLTLLLLPLSVLVSTWMQGSMSSPNRKIDRRVLAAALALLLLPLAGWLMVRSASCVCSLAVAAVLYLSARESESTVAA